MRIEKLLLPILTASSFSLLPGCTHHEVETKSQVNTVSEIKPIEVKPIHIIIDINVKVDRALDNFFGDLDKQADEAAPDQHTK